MEVPWTCDFINTQGDGISRRARVQAFMAADLHPAHERSRAVDLPATKRALGLYFDPFSAVANAIQIKRVSKNGISSRVAYPQWWERLSAGQCWSA